MDSIEKWDENIARARQSLWVLDACFSGLAGTQRKAPLEDKTRRRLAQRAHDLITAGTSGEELVAVGGVSLFTSAFIEAARGAADLPNDGMTRRLSIIARSRARPCMRAIAAYDQP